MSARRCCLRLLTLVLLLAPAGCQMPGRSESANPLSATGGRPGQQMALSKPAPDATSSPLWKKPFDATSDLVAASREKLSTLGPDKSTAGNQRPKSPSGKASATKDIEGMLAMARLVERRGENDKAKEMYQAILAKSPQQPVALHRLGVVNAQDGKLDEAARLLTQAATVDAPSAELLSDLGYTYFLSRKFPEAEQRLREALQLEPDYDAARTNLGLVLGMQGKTDRAMSEFRSVASESEAQANLAFVYTQLGDLENAQKHYLIALDVDSELIPAAEALVQLDHFSKVRENSAKRRNHQAIAAQEELLAKSAETSVSRKNEPAATAQTATAREDNLARAELIWKPADTPGGQSQVVSASFAPPSQPDSDLPTATKTGRPSEGLQATPTDSGTGSVVHAEPWIKKRPAPVVDGETYRRQFQGAPVFKGSIQTAVADERSSADQDKTQWASYNTPASGPSSAHPPSSRRQSDSRNQSLPPQVEQAPDKSGGFGSTLKLDVFKSFLPAAGRPGLPFQKTEPHVKPSSTDNAPGTEYPMRRATWMGSRQPISTTGLPSPSNEAAEAANRPSYDPGW